MRFILSALVLASLMACASKPIFISDSGRHAIDGSIYSGQATVYVIRDSSSSGAVWPIAIKLDGEDKGSLSRESFVHFPAAPGRHDIWAHWNPINRRSDDQSLQERGSSQWQIGEVFAQPVSLGVALIWRVIAEPNNRFERPAAWGREATIGT